MPSNIKNLVVNRKATFEYFVHDRFEAGIALVGSEVKSLRGGKGNLQEAHVKLGPDGAWLLGCHIAPYLQANINNHPPVRPRRLLLHRHELLKLRRGTLEKGMTIIPLRVYLKGPLVKVEIALAKGKKLYDKRAALREKAIKRDQQR